ncbi:MAG TPA: DUF4129 domain-containing protein [Chryseolinea sp.]|nr:DUF4129 domain-containing protein [Chryseolinea sp.]
MRLVFVLMMLVSLCASAQKSDSLETSVDTTAASVFEDKPDDKAIADTMAVTVRNFNGQALQELKADQELQYGDGPTVGESLWKRFLRWIGEFIEALMESATTTHWGRFFAYTFLLISLIVIILMVLKVNAYRVFYGDAASPVPHRTLDENIHEMDFERLIQEAVANQDYRLGVRLLFLSALKLLSDKNHIHWTQGKTNHDYLNELSADDLKKGFSELSYFFEYAWYGNFLVTDGVYDRVRQTFDTWRRNL